MFIYHFTVSILTLKMYWLLKGFCIMLECLYSSHVSNEAQSIENINDRKRLLFFFFLMTKIIYILKLLPKVIAQQSRQSPFHLQFTWKLGPNYLFSLADRKQQTLSSTKAQTQPHTVLHCRVHVSYFSRIQQYLGRSKTRKGMTIREPMRQKKMKK